MGKTNFLANQFSSCSVNEKLETIPEGELKQKPQTTSTQNRTSTKAPSPPPTSSLTTRSSTTNKRISNGEISSTTAAAIAAVNIIFDLVFFFLNDYFRIRNQYHPIPMLQQHQLRLKNDLSHHLVHYLQNQKQIKNANDQFHNKQINQKVKLVVL
jgi:hypothetical protein